MNDNIMNTQIFHKFQYDLIGHGRSHKALLANLVLAFIIYQPILINFSLKLKLWMRKFDLYSYGQLLSLFLMHSPLIVRKKILKIFIINIICYLKQKTPYPHNTQSFVSIKTNLIIFYSMQIIISKRHVIYCIFLQFFHAIYHMY